MRLIKYEFSRVYQIGEWEIRYDVRHNCFDVSKGNIHRLCCNTLVYAVEFVLNNQGWEVSTKGAETIALELANKMVDTELTSY